MTTAAEAISYIRSWQGYRDNSGAKVWAAYAPVNYTGSSYCGAGQGMLAKHFGLSLAPTTHARIIYVPYVVTDARAAGKWIYSKDSKPGDWVIFSWGNGYHDIAAGNADHIGIVVANDPHKSTVTTFEFNTTDGAGRGPRGAFLRTRSRSDIMGCVDRQAVYTAPPNPTPAPTTATLQKGSTGAAVKALQMFLMHNYPAYAGRIKSTGGADGRFGDGTAAVVAEFQRRSGLVADSIVGPKTWTALTRAGFKA